MSKFKIGDKVKFFWRGSMNNSGRIFKVINFEDGGCDIYGNTVAGDKYIVTMLDPDDIRINPELIDERNIEAILVGKEEFAIEILKDLNDFIKKTSCMTQENPWSLAVSLIKNRVKQKIKELEDLE